jgi:hypothetical protein
LKNTRNQKYTQKSSFHFIFIKHFSVHTHTHTHERMRQQKTQTQYGIWYNVPSDQIQKAKKIVNTLSQLIPCRNQIRSQCQFSLLFIYIRDSLSLYPTPSFPPRWCVLTIIFIIVIVIVMCRRCRSSRPACSKKPSIRSKLFLGTHNL